MSWHFWLIAVVIFWFVGPGRRWRQLPRDRARARHRQNGEIATGDPGLVAEVEAQRNYIGDLESRVAELENRLDFAERMLSSRNQPEPGITSR